MLVCDICNKNMNWSDGYILTTSQVVTTESYWSHALHGTMAHLKFTDPKGATLFGLVKQLADQSSGWLVCENCSQLFTFDKEEAKEYALNQNTHPPGVGPADINEATLAAANAWKRLYEKYPISIKIQ